MIKNFRGMKPNLHKEVYVSENVVILGDITLKRNSSVWFGSVIRGDSESIIIGENTNIQDNCIIHVEHDIPVEIGNGCTIGHGAIMHGCKIGNNTLIGMGSIILNGAKIGNNTIVGAGSLVTQNKQFEDGVLIIGNPAKAVRKLTEQEIEENRKAASHYVQISRELKKEQDN